MSDVILKSIFPVSKTVRTRTGAVNTVIGLQGAPGATGPTGATGPAGADGAAGPNTVTSSTTTDLTGFLKGDGANIIGVTKIPSSSLDANNFSLTSGSTNLTLNSVYVELSCDNYAGGVAVVNSSVILSAENGIQAQNVIRPDPGNIYVFSTTVDNLTLSNKPIEYLRDTFIGTSSVDIRGLETSANVFNLAPVKILNVGTSTYTFKHESTAVSAANRYKCVTGADIQLRPNEQVEIYYDPEVSRCRVFLPTRVGMEIGGTVTGATAGRVLYVGAGPVLADSANLTFDGNILNVKEIRIPSQVPAATTNPLVIDSVVSGVYTEPVFRIYVSGNDPNNGLQFRTNSYLQLNNGISLNSFSDFLISGSAGDDYYSIRRSIFQRLQFEYTGADDHLDIYSFYAANTSRCSVIYSAKSSTRGRGMLFLDNTWIDNTDATRKAQSTRYICDTSRQKVQRDFADGSRGYTALNVHTTAPADGDLQNSELCFYTDGSGNVVMKLKDSSGTVRSATINLST